MHTSPVPSEQDLLYTALIEALHFIAAMDRSNGEAGLHNAMVVPDVIIWALEQRNPELLARLHSIEQVDTLRDLLAQYGSLRVVAERLRRESFCEACDAAGVASYDDGYLTPEVVLEALDSGTWSCDTPGIHALFENALFALTERVALDIPAEHHHVNTTWRPVAERNLDAFALAPTPIPESSALPVLALAHANQQLLACDDGYDPSLWENSYTSVVCDWLERDLLDIAREIIANGLTTEYVDRLLMYRFTMRCVEKMWQGLSHPIRALLLGAQKEEDALRVLEAFIRAVPDPDSDASDWVVLLWEMVKRRNVEARAVPVHICDIRSSELDSVRSTANDVAACCVVDTESLPASLRTMTDEQQVLLVRVTEDWLHHSDELTQGNLECVYLENRVTGKWTKVLGITPAFCCNYEELWPLMFGWRRSVPILYVFEERCVFAVLPFHHFPELKTIANIPKRQLPTVAATSAPLANDLTVEQVSVDRASNEGRLLSVHSTVADLRTKSDTQTLRNTYQTQNPTTQH